MYYVGFLHFPKPTFTVYIHRDAMVDFWWQAGEVAATAAAVFYFLKSSQGPSLGCLASRGGPDTYHETFVKS